MPEGLNTHAHSGQPKPRRRVSSIHRSLRAIRLLAPACDMSQLFRWRIFLRNHPPRRSPGAYQRMIRFPLRASIPINPNVANELHIYSVLLFATTFRELIASDSMPAFEKITMQNNPVARALVAKCFIKQRDGGPGRTRTYNQQFPSQQLNMNGFNDFPKFLVGRSRQF